MTIATKLTKLMEYPELFLDKLTGECVGRKYMAYCVKDIFPKIDTYIDVGANNGISLKSVQGVFHGFKAYCFEPVTEEIPNIQKVADKANAGDFKPLKLEIFNFGLWNENGELTFYKNLGNSMKSSLFDDGEDNANKHLKKEKITIPVKRFDSLGLKFEGITYLKVDAEGAEKEVLEGFGDELKKVHVVQFENHFRNNFNKEIKLSEIFSILEKYGFDCFLQKKIRHEAKEPNHCEYIAYRLNDARKRK